MRIGETEWTHWLHGRREGSARPVDEKLCHNCDTKPVFAVKTDFIDKMNLLIPRNLLKTQIGSKIPAYRFTR